MDAAQFHIWREDFRREVEQVLTQMRAVPAAPGASPPALFPGELAALLAEERALVQSLRGELEQVRADLARQQAALRLETTRRQRLKELCAKLSWALKSRGAS